MRNLWYQLSRTGYHQGLSRDDKKVILLINRLALIVSLILLIYSPFAFLEDAALFPVMIVDAALYAFTIYLNKIGMIKAARYYIIIISLLDVSMVSVLAGDVTGEKYFFIIVSVLPLLFFRNKKTIISLFILTVIFFITVCFLQTKITPVIVVPDSEQFLYYLTNIAIVFGLIFISVLYHKRDNEKYEIQLILKNEEIEIKNKEIIDSINYAKRIQQAKLPDKEEIQKAFPDSFVLFKPKDIVSGDFYYFHKSSSSVLPFHKGIKEKNIFIAAADCTGHGVPGAFMSMIGSEKIDDALAHSTDTSEILSLLNKGIKASLRQSGNSESTRDGMDIALCAVDTENCIVKYAGANRPLWIIRGSTSHAKDEQVTVEEVKATKKAIGGFTDDSQNFETHTIQLQHGDCFYIFSDGYADLFGKNGKKLMTKKFKQVLLEIHSKSMTEQGKHLEEFAENWKGETEQVDDILVIGIRL